MVCFFTAGHTPALKYASEMLKNSYHFSIGLCDKITHLLLPVPSFDSHGFLKGGGSMKAVLDGLPKNITVIGGNLDSKEFPGYTVIDLLKDPIYLDENANITAHCAVLEAFQHSSRIIDGCRVLVLGWGRIGKRLALLLKNMGASVTIYARKSDARAQAVYLGFTTSDLDPQKLENYDVIFNTVPAMILPHPPSNPLKIDLASVRGIGGDDILLARGLPGNCAPASSGQLIARTVKRLIGQEGLE